MAVARTWLFVVWLATAAARASLATMSRLPCVGTVASPDGSRELIVVGTAHTPCRSAEEVAAAIDRARPDVVVIELDQERLDGLLSGGGTRRYGADFEAAVRSASHLGVPIVLGDAKARDTFALMRAPGALMSGARLGRAVQLALFTPPDARASYVNIPATLYADPAKMLPLLAGVWWTVLLSGLSGLVISPLSPATAAAAAADGTHDALRAAWAAASAAGGTLVIAAAARVWDVLLLSRDDQLAESARRGLDLASGLSRSELLRFRFPFSTGPQALSAATRPPEGTTPLFTLKRPLLRGEVRRLNLFEPRWLALLDTLAEEREREREREAEADAEARAAGATRPDPNTLSPPPSPLADATFGTVVGINRVYAPAPACALAEEGAAEADDGAADAADAADAAGAAAAAWAAPRPPDRLADIILRPVGRMARVVHAEEGVRPVTGSRRVSVWIRGEQPLAIDPDSLAPTTRGFLAGRVCECEEAQLEVGIGEVAMAADAMAGEEAAAADAATMEDATGTAGESATSLLDDGATDAEATAGPDAISRPAPRERTIARRPLELPPEAATRRVDPVRVLSVVGLAHANGVLARCASDGLGHRGRSLRPE